MSLYVRIDMNCQFVIYRTLVIPFQFILRLFAFHYKYYDNFQQIF